MLLLWHGASSSAVNTKNKARNVISMTRTIDGSTRREVVQTRTVDGNTRRSYGGPRR